MYNVLIVEDQDNARTMLRKHVAKQGYTVFEAENLSVANKVIETEFIDIVLLDINLPDGSGLQLLERITKEMPSTQVVVITGHGDIETAVHAMHMGASDFMAKPIDTKRMFAALDRCKDTVDITRELNGYREAQRMQLNGYVQSNAPAMQQVERYVGVVAPQDTDVLLTGETGTGKEVIAQLIHSLSRRKDKQFVAVNCAGIPPETAHSELFGHEKGAFTGADTKHTGKFQFAHGGTIFLDEIARMPLAIQQMILRVLEERKITRMRSNKEEDIDVRVIAASNLDLEQKIATGEFLPDLYYRLNVIPINIPALRDRKEDIPVFAGVFLNTFQQKAGKRIDGFSDAALQALKDYHWPGNVRQLRNAIERAVLFCEGDSTHIQVGHLPDYARKLSQTTAQAPFLQHTNSSASLN